MSYPVLNPAIFLPAKRSPVAFARRFELASQYRPAGDQPQAIAALTEGLRGHGALHGDRRMAALQSRASTICSAAWGESGGGASNYRARGAGRGEEASAHNPLSLDPRSNAIIGLHRQIFMQLEVSRKFSRKVFDDGYEAINNHDHPCHHMMCRQEVEGIKPPYQLPEPFSGRRSTHRLVFVGLNPSISAGELIPLATDERDFDGYDSHYRKRFDGCNRGPDGKLIVRLANTDPHIPRLWRNIELFGRRHVPTFAGGCFSLGENALLVEIVHYKTKKGWIGKSKADQDRVLRHQFCVTGALLDELAPCVLVPMGNAATRQLCRLFALEAQSKRSVAQLMGHTLEGRRGGERVLITPIKHLSYPPPHDIQAAVGRQISRAIEREMPACRQYRKLT